MNKNEVVKVGKTKKQFRFSNHGISIIEYIRSDVELWLKVLAFLMHWYMNPKNAGKAFFMKHETIKGVFNKWGFECTNSGIKDALKKLAADDLGLIKIVYADRDADFNYMTKSEWVAAGNNPKKYIYRRIYLNWAKLRKYMSVFTGESHVLKDLPSKARLKKLIYKRFMSYTWTLQAMFDKQMKESKIEKYTSAHKMFYGFIFTYSKKYYDPTALIKNYIPEHAIDLQKEHDSQAFDYAMGVLDEALKKHGQGFLKHYQVTGSEASSKASNEAPLVVKEFFNSIK